MFTIEAALALLNECLLLYESKEFVDGAKKLDDSWAKGVDMTYIDQTAAIDNLCLSTGLDGVLQRYGFCPDEKGSAEIKSVMSELAISSVDVMERQLQVQRQIFSCFTNLVPPDPKAPVVANKLSKGRR